MVIVQTLSSNLSILSSSRARCKIPNSFDPFRDQTARAPYAGTRRKWSESQRTCAWQPEYALLSIIARDATTTKDRRSHAEWSRFGYAAQFRRTVAVDRDAFDAHAPRHVTHARAAVCSIYIWMLIDSASRGLASRHIFVISTRYIRTNSGRLDGNNVWCYYIRIMNVLQVITNSFGYLLNG